MPLIESSFQDFAMYIKKSGKQIICFGAGMVPFYIEPLLTQYGLIQKVFLFIDSNARKADKVLFYGGKNIAIKMPEYLRTLKADHYVILITAEKYREIADALRSCTFWNKWECFAYPLLNLSYFKSIDKMPVISSAASRIPKIIHYTWFGNKEKQELHEKCLASWRKFCPDYEIREWNEKNYDIHKSEYVSQAYEAGKWAYVSDYARMDILYQYGGVYFDADVEFLKKIDMLLSTEAFICFGEWPAPNSGAGAGCVKGNRIVKEMMETREGVSFIQSDGSNDPHTNSNYELQVMARHGFRMDFSFQMAEGMAFYPPDIIAPVSVAGEDSFVTERTLGIHYCNNSWRG